MSYDPFEVLQEKVAAPRLQREEQAAAAPSPSISLAEAAEQSGLPEAVLAAAVRKGTLNTRTIADDGVLRPGVQLDEVEFARESLLTRAAPPQPFTAEFTVEDEAQDLTGDGPQDVDAQDGGATVEPDVDADGAGGHTAPDSGSRHEEATADEDRSAALVEVELAVQGWREAKEALEVAREEHRAELVRLERVIVASEERESSTRQWGRAAAVAGGVILLGAAGFVIQLQSGHGEALSSERQRAGLLQGQLQAAGQQLEQRTEEALEQAASAAAASDRAERASLRSVELAARVAELEAERAAAAVAWEQALSSLGWR